MKSLRRYHNQRVMLLLAGILLAAQTILFWHSHHGSAAPDEHCQICLHAQHHSPAPGTLHAPVLVLFTQIEVIKPVSSKTLHSVYHYYTPSRAPPAVPLA